METMNGHLQIPIDAIVIKNRIREDLGDIKKLATDIQENGLIQPPVVTPEYILIAGERRIRACQSLGFKKIEVRVMKVWDYEHHLKLEISENEQRKELTHSERQAYAREVERIEREKARERQLSTLTQNTVPANSPERDHKGETRDIVAKAVGYGSGTTYREAKFVVENGEPEIVAKLDAGKISVHRAYQDTKRQKEDNTEGKVVPLKKPDKELVAQQNADYLAKQKPVFGTLEDYAIKKTLDDMTALLAEQASILRSQIYEMGDICHIQHVILNGAYALRKTAREIEELVDVQVNNAKVEQHEKVSIKC